MGDLHIGVEDVSILLECDIASLGDTALYPRGTDTLTSPIVWECLLRVVPGISVCYLHCILPMKFELLLALHFACYLCSARR